MPRIIQDDRKRLSAFGYWLFKDTDKHLYDKIQSYLIRSGFSRPQISYAKTGVKRLSESQVMGLCKITGKDLRVLFTPSLRHLKSEEYRTPPEFNFYEYLRNMDTDLNRLLKNRLSWNQYEHLAETLNEDPERLVSFIRKDKTPPFSLIMNLAELLEMDIKILCWTYFPGVWEELQEERTTKEVVYIHPKIAVRHAS